MNTIQFWMSPLLEQPNISHGFTYRSGGVSSAPYENLNLGLHVGDHPENVVENRRRVAEAAGFSLESIVCAEQVHGSKVAVVDTSHRGRGSQEFKTTISGVDALVTNSPDTLLMLFFADCLPVFFADPVNNVVAIAHAGWRGLVGGVVENTIEVMHTTFGSCPEQILTAVGPGIGSQHFAVGPEVARQFPPVVVHEREQPCIDLATAAHIRLLDAGIPPENLTIATDCTASNPERYFSHRRDKGTTGRMAGFIGIRPDTTREP